MVRAPVAESPRSYCLFTSGPHALGVAVGSVVEVIPRERLVRLPLCPRQVAGLCAYRGGFLPVVGLETAGDRAEVGDDQGRAVLILWTESGSMGLLIDRRGVSVEDGVAGLDGAESTDLGGLEFAGTIARGGRRYRVLDPERTWQALRDRVEKWYRDALGPGRPGGVGTGLVGMSGNAVARDERRVKS